MEVLMIFTNPQSVFRYYRKQLIWDLYEDPFHRIPINSSSEFWLIYDELEDNSVILDAIQSSKPRAIFNLYHRKPKIKLLDELKEELGRKGIDYYSKKSQHPDKETYGQIIEINTHYENKYRLEEIFIDLKKKLGIDQNLENKLNLLHKCLFPSEIPKRIPDWLFNNGRKELEKLTELRDYSPFDPEYIRALRDLRNALLGNN